MATMKEQMQSARAYIEAKQWDDARRILKQVDHPTARAWLEKVNEIDPPKPTVGPFLEEDLWIGAVLLGGAFMLAVIVTSIYDSAGAVQYDYERLNVLGFFTALFFVSLWLLRRHWQSR